MFWTLHFPLESVLKELTKPHGEYITAWEVRKSAYDCVCICLYTDEKKVEGDTEETFE